MRSSSFTTFETKLQLIFNYCVVKIGFGGLRSNWGVETTNYEQEGNGNMSCGEG